VGSRRIFKVLTLVLILVFVPLHSEASNLRIERIVDGDTIRLASGEYVRLIQIDTPEIRGNECFAKEAREILANLLAQKGTRTLKADPNLDQIDSRKRLLRYLFIGKTNINLKLVEMGAATPWFFEKKLGRYSKELMAAVETARSKKLGLWSACPGTKLNVYGPLTTVYPSEKQPPNSQNSASCDPNYEGCIPLFPPDLDCSEIKKLGLAPVRVIGQDVHKLDRDGDGIGCD
jgi:endonuclease YncB( thermonuclease family)